VFARVSELVQLVNRLVQINGLGYLLEVKRGLDLQGDGDEETGAAEATEGRHEEVRVLCSGTPDWCSVRQEETEREHMCGNYSVVDA